MLNDYSNLVKLLRQRATQQPEKIAYTFLTNDETESKSITYRDLDQQVRAIAANLQALKAENTRVLVVYPYSAGLEFIAAFFGCLYAKVIAVTDNPPRNSQALIKLQERIISSEATVALTTESLLTQIKYQLAQNPDLAPKLTSIPWIATETLTIDAANEWVEPEISEDTIAFLQHTSGSTGIPKGVIVTHGNTIHNSHVIYQAFGHHQDSRGLIWLPLFHDMGLIGGVMQPLYAGFTGFLMSPIALIQKPFSWLQAISKYQATSSGGPNFAYDLLSKQIKPEHLENLDLSSWDVAFSGAEPVRAETLERFAKTFAPCGFRAEAFYPCYGMAETTLFVSGGNKTQPPVIKYLDQKALENNQVITVDSEDRKAHSFVGCGYTYVGDQMVIVNPESLTKCAPHQIGEIWVKGNGVGKGYWNQPEATQQTFGAYLQDTQEGPFLRTGDLGFMDNGELFITGRIKDLMILWGRNHYPQHIELTVQESHPALRLNAGAAFSVEVENEERLVIVQEIERSYLRDLDLEEIFSSIRQAIAVEYIAEVYAILLLKPASIPKTSSGKIQRRLCRQKFLENSFESIGEWRVDLTKSVNILDLMNSTNS